MALDVQEEKKHAFIDLSRKVDLLLITNSLKQRTILLMGF